MRRRPTLPALATHQPFAFSRAARAHERNHDGEIGCVVGENVRSVGDNDARRRASLEVYVADAGAEIAYRLRPERVPGEHVCADPIGYCRANKIEPTERVGYCRGGEREILRVEGRIKGCGDRGLGRAWP